MDFGAIQNYLKEGSYPQNYDKNAKRRLREQAGSYLVTEDLLYRKHKCGNRLVILNEDKRSKMIECVHAGVGDGIEGASLGAHLGRDKTRAKLSEKYFWPGMFREIDEYLKHCLRCQKNSARIDKVSAELHSVQIDAIPMHQIGIDLCSLPEDADGYKAVIVIVDYFTKYVLAKPVKDKKAETVTQFIYEEIICRYGCPAIQINDQGREFVSTISNKLHRLTGTTQRVTSAYHPQVRNSESHYHTYMLFYLHVLVCTCTFFMYLHVLVCTCTFFMHKLVLACFNL